MNKLLMFLQMFAGEETAAAAPAETGVGTAAENPATEGGEFTVGQRLPDGTQVADARVAAALNRQMKRHPEMRQNYMVQGQNPVQRPVPQGQGNQPAQPAGQPAAQPAADGRKPWAEIIKEYPDEYGADIAAHIKDRFPQNAEMKAQLDKQKTIIDFAMRNAGVESVDELLQVIADDDSPYEQEAEERNMTVEQLKYVKELEAEKARNDQAAQAARDEAHVRQLYGQYEELKKIYPDIDFFKEMQDPEFFTWTSPSVGMSFEAAYYAKHGKELQTQAVAFGMDRTRQQLGQTIAAQQKRPGEGAMSGKNQAAAAEPKMNPANMKRNEIKKLKEWIKAHPDKVVSFG